MTDATGFVVAADGGNSKTDLLIATTGGEVLARVRGTGTHPDEDGYDVTAGMLVGLIAQACDQAGLPADTVFELGAFFCANVDTPDQVVGLKQAIEDTGICTMVDVGNDSMAILHAGAPEGWGIAVVTGTGINAVGRDRQGRIEGFLSIGRETGDLGGGSWFAMEGQAASIRAADGRGPATMLEQLIPDYFGMSDPFEVALALNDGTISWHRMLHSCPVVFQAAEAGDPVALGLFERQADEISLMANALVKRLAMDEPEIPVVMGGSVSTNGGQLYQSTVAEALLRRVPNAKPVFLAVPPVEGSLAHALRMVAGQRATTAS